MKPETDSRRFSNRGHVAILILTVAMFAIIVAIIVAADRRVLPAALMEIYNFPGGDKLGHVVLFGGLAFLVEMSLRGRTFPAAGRVLSLGGLVLAVAVTIEELSQQFFPGRSFSLADLAASYAGILMGIALARRSMHQVSIDHPRHLGPTT